MGAIGRFLCKFLKHRWHYHARDLFSGRRHYERTHCHICGAWFATPDDADCCSGWVSWKYHQNVQEFRREKEYEDHMEEIRLEEEVIVRRAKEDNLNCPYCKGITKETDKSWCDYDRDCCRCGRGWRIDGHGTWNALFDAASKVYTAREVVERHNRY